MTPALPEPGAPAEADGGRAAADAPDLRAVALGAAGWAGGLLVILGQPRPSAVLVGVGLLVAAGAVVRRVAGVVPWTLVACTLACAAVAGAALIGVESHRASPVARLAEAEASVVLVGRVVSDPVVRQGRFAPFVLVRLRSQQVTGLGGTYVSAVPVLLIADAGWKAVRLGDVVEVTGRLRQADGPGVAAVLLPRRGPQVVATTGRVLAAAESVRAGIRDATARGHPEASALVPALVVGDDRQMSDDVVADFRTTGLTHLAAVSGTNLTLVVGFLVVVARAVGVRARGLAVVGLLGVVGFVLLARTEPSVVRAATMGTIALIGLGSHGRQRGARALGIAVLVLLLLDPWLAVSWGFALSVTATAGILFLAPGLRDRLMRWLPRWVAEAVAVPFAAQLVCTPLLAALSGQVSLVAVAANMLVAAAVGPATVLGLLGGLVDLVLPPVAAVIGLGAVGCGWWIVTVATQLARLPAAAVEWPSGPVALSVLTAACVALAALSGRVLGAPGPAVAATLLLAGLVVVPMPSPGWPPRGWLLVACDVGQGDGLVLNAGDGRAVVVDTGPDPGLMDDCLRRLRVNEVPVVVLTHFHADHVDGLPGVLRGREVGQVLVTGLAAPAEGAAAVTGWAVAAGVPLRVTAFGEVGAVGDLTWQVVGPARLPRGGATEDAANDASAVLLAEIEGVRILAGGDMERPAQAMLRRTVPGLRVDVLKVPHHGSADQDPELLSGLGARVAVISVGEGNSYGHPAPATLDLLARGEAMVRRTDLHGDVAVLLREGDLRVTSRE